MEGGLALERFLLLVLPREDFFRTERILTAFLVSSEEAVGMEWEDFISDARNKNLGVQKKCPFSAEWDSDQILQHLELPLRILNFFACNLASE